MTKAWKLFTPEQAAVLRTLSPMLADKLQEVVKSDLDGEVGADRRPMKGKFVLSIEYLDGYLTRSEYDPASGQVRDVPDADGALLYVAAATAEDFTLVADQEMLF